MFDKDKKVELDLNMEELVVLGTFISLMGLKHRDSALQLIHLLDKSRPGSLKHFLSGMDKLTVAMGGEAIGDAEDFDTRKFTEDEIISSKKNGGKRFWEF